MVDCLVEARLLTGPLAYEGSTRVERSENLVCLLEDAWVGALLSVYPLDIAEKDVSPSESQVNCML